MLAAGLCPCRYFAQNAGVEVHGYHQQRAVSSIQNRIAEAGLEDKVFVYHGDYHDLESVIRTDSLTRLLLGIFWAFSEA